MRPRARKIFPWMAGGFTLLEVLVGIALLAVIGLLIIQLITVTTRATRMSNSGIDAAAQARLAFDRIGIDLSARVKRWDVDFQATNSFAAGPPYSLMFLSEVTSAGVSATNNRGVSLVGYQIATNSEVSRPCLLRGGKALAWTTGGVTGYQTNGLPVPLSAIPVSLSPQDFDVLAPAVIRAVVGFQLYPSGEPVRLADGTQTAADGRVVYSPPVLYDNDGASSTMIDTSQISSLIVGLVAVDPEALKLADATQVGQLASYFPVPPAGDLPVKTWASMAEKINEMPTAVPLPVRQSTRVFQRAFPITPYGVSAL